MLRSKAHVARMEELCREGTITRKHLDTLYRETAEAGIDVSDLPDRVRRDPRGAPTRLGVPRIGKIRKVKTL